MLTYKYEARDPGSGQKIKAEVQADSEQAAAKLIRAQGFAPIEIKLDGGGFINFDKIFNRVSVKDKILFARQLSTLINAGLPLLQSLRNVAEQTKNKTFKSVINQIISDVEGGSAFSAALGRHSEMFSNVFISLIAAGEVSGTLDASLERIANQQEKDAEITSKVKGAMVYPLIVIVVMIAVVGFMIVTVLPQVEVMYQGMGNAQLPLITQLLLSLSKFVTTYWYVMVIILIIVVIGGSRYVRTLGGKQVTDRLKLKIWPVAPLFMKVYMARFARTGSVLVSSGVPLIQMLQITADAINNVHLTGSINTAIEKVKGGRSLSEAIRNDENFLDLVPNMLSIGEQSGAIEQMLEKIADYYEKEVDNQIKTISTIIEPVMMVLLGVVAFIIVAAVLLPVYSLAGKTVL